MEIREMERQVLKVCAQNGWDMKPFDDLGLLTEEVGELAREVRRMENGRQRPDEIDPDADEIREHMAEEIGDILFPLIKIAAYYNISLEKAFKMHIDKMGGRTKDALENADALRLAEETSMLASIRTSILVEDRASYRIYYLLSLFTRLEGQLNRLTPISVANAIKSLNQGSTAKEDVELLYKDVIALKKMAGEPL